MKNNPAREFILRFLPVLLVLPLSAVWLTQSAVADWLVIDLLVIESLVFYAFLLYRFIERGQQTEKLPKTISQNNRSRVSASARPSCPVAHTYNLDNCSDKNQPILH